jgi:hypothetical protein
MPVMNTEIVKYDCNVSMANDPFGPSATMIVELMDGYEEAPDLLQAHLVGAVIKRLKVVAHTSPRTSPYNNVTGRAEYVVDISTDRGYHLGRLKVSMPFDTGWNDTSVNMGESYLQSEAEGHIERMLRKHLTVRINQRTPPLPRKAADARGFGQDMVFPAPAVASIDDIEEAKLKIQQSIFQQMMARREQELVQRSLHYDPFTRPVPPRWEHARLKPAVPAPYPFDRLGKDTTRNIDVATHEDRDVARRSDDSSRVDTAFRGGRPTQDVAEMGVELDL